MSNLSTYTLLNEQPSEPLDNLRTPLLAKRISHQQGSFHASPLFDGKKIDLSLLLKNKINQLDFEGDHKQPFSVIVINTINNPSPKSDEKDEEELDVSQEFVNEFNAHIGNDGNKKKAELLLNKMKLLGGLIPSLNKEDIDIPAARLGFSFLAGLNNPKYKMEALKNLELLLQNDELKKETSNNLVNLAISLMKQMNRELMQTEILDVQIKITEVYGLVAELLQRHYSKKHINAITKELKIELIATTKALEALNSQQDQRLNFYTRVALEGIRRLVDDRKELFDLIDRFIHAFLASYAIEECDIVSVYQELSNTFKDLDPHVKGAWYNGVLILNELAKDAKDDIQKLVGIQTLLKDKGKEFNWKFTYAALEILSDLTLNGSTLEIREAAFQGIKVFQPEFPGLTSLVNSNNLSRYVDFGPMVHFKRPHVKNPNTLIRKLCVEHLANIANQSQDSHIRKKAKFILAQRLRFEKNEKVLTALKGIVPDSKENQRKWIQEF